MSRQAVAVIFAVCAVPSAGAVTPGPDRSVVKDGPEFRNYARQLLTFTQTVSERYARPVSQIDLVESALKGLFDAARRPVPAGLRQDLERANADGDLLGCVVRLRAGLGNEPALAGMRDVLASVKAVPAALDPHCGLVASPTTRVLEEGPVRDLGVEIDTGVLVPRPGAGALYRVPELEPVSETALPLVVREVKPGSPAQRAGIRPHDVLTRINGKSITAENAASVFNELVTPGGPESQALELNLRREGRDSPVVVRVAKNTYRPESVFGVRRTPANAWDPWLDRDGRLACLRLGFLDQDTPGNLAEMLYSAEQGGMRGLILDLRWCPGGYLTPAAAVAALFLPNGVVAGTKSREPVATPRVFVAEDPSFPRFKAGNYPILVLVSGETSGGGELIAAALQDHKRAVIAGQRTLGKASVQSVVYLPELHGLSFKLTSGMFTRPSGKALHRFADARTTDEWGVQPDRGCELPTSRELSHWLKEQTAAYTLRPGSSREALPLDDPEVDSQRQAALQLLRNMVRKAPVAAP